MSNEINTKQNFKMCFLSFHYVLHKCKKLLDAQIHYHVTFITAVSLQQRKQELPPELHLELLWFTYMILLLLLLCIPRNDLITIVIY